jgi:hypothetical protein
MSDNLSKAGIALSELEGWAGKHARLGQGRMGLQGAGLWDLEMEVQERRKEIEGEVKERRETVMNILRDLEAKNEELSEELAHYRNDVRFGTSIYDHVVSAHDIDWGAVEEPKRRGVETSLEHLRDGDLIDVYPELGGDTFPNWEGAKFVVDQRPFVNAIASNGNEGLIADFFGHKVHLVERPNPTLEDLKTAPVGARIKGGGWNDSVRREDGWHIDSEALGGQTGIEPEHIIRDADRKLVYP